MATREAVTDTDLTEDTYNSGGANLMARAFYTVVPSTTMFAIGMCVSKLVAGVSSVPYFEQPITALVDMVDRRNTLDYAMCLGVAIVVSGPSDSGSLTLQTMNTGTG